MPGPTTIQILLGDGPTVLSLEIDYVPASVVDAHRYAAIVAMR